MSLLMDQTVASIVGVSFLLLLGFRERRHWLDSLNVSVMAGFIGIGVLAYVLVPSPLTSVELLPLYEPHAYNLILWPSLGLLILRKRFPPKLFLLSFAFVYAIDELIWTGLSVVYFSTDASKLSFMLIGSWMAFMAILIGTVLIGHLVLRPKLSPYPMWLVPVGFGAVWLFAGFPTLAVANPFSLSFAQISYRLAWELMWQGAYWVFAYATVMPR